MTTPARKFENVRSQGSSGNASFIASFAALRRVLGEERYLPPERAGNAESRRRAVGQPSEEAALDPFITRSVRGVPHLSPADPLPRSLGRQGQRSHRSNSRDHNTSLVIHRAGSARPGLEPSKALSGRARIRPIGRGYAHFTSRRAGPVPVGKRVSRPVCCNMRSPSVATDRGGPISWAAMRCARYEDERGQGHHRRGRFSSARGDRTPVIIIPDDSPWRSGSSTVSPDRGIRGPSLDGGHHPV